MSHVTKIGQIITDLDSLKRACEDCGCELIIGQKTFRWYGQWVNDYDVANSAYHHGIKPEDYGKCEHAIRVKGANSRTYEVGVCKNPQGAGFVLVYDNYCGGNGLEAKIGREAVNVVQGYSSHAAHKHLTIAGFRVAKSWFTPEGVKKYEYLPASGGKY